MKLRNVIATLLLFVGAQAWAQMPDMTVPVDTAVRIGKLSNGLTYYIRHNNWPEHRANAPCQLLHCAESRLLGGE